MTNVAYCWLMIDTNRSIAPNTETAKLLVRLGHIETISETIRPD